MAKRPRVRSNFLPSTCSEQGPSGCFSPFFLSSLPCHRDEERVYEIAEQQGPRCPVGGRDSIAMLNRPLDRAREEVTVGNLFILISVRHKPPQEERREKTKASSKTSWLIVSVTGRSSRVHDQRYLYTSVEF